MSKFVLMRRDPSRKSFADWRPLTRFENFELAIRARERLRKEDKKADDARWEYQIETVS